MRDVRVAALAGRQHNRIALRQLLTLGLSVDAVAHRVATGRLVVVEEGVDAVARCSMTRAAGGWARR